MAKNHMLKQMFIVTNKIKRLLDKKHRKNGISTGQARLISFLYRNRDEVIYQKDIETEFQIRGGSVTGIVDTLVESGYVNRLASERDRRKNKIILTEEGINMALKSMKTVEKIEEDLAMLLNKEEKKYFNQLITKINDWTDQEELND